MTNQEEERLSAFIVDVVEQHYGKTERPLLLAALGLLVTRSEEVRLPEGVALARFIQTRLVDKLQLLRDASDPKIIAVVDEVNRTRVAEAIQRRLAGAASLVPRVPHSLRVAFCRTLDEGERIFFRTRPPFKYFVGSQPPDSSFIEIGEEFRLPGSEVHKDVRLPPEEERKLQSNLDRWMSTNQIPRDVFRNAIRRQDLASSGSALRRLVEAQDHDVQGRLMIPADIALLLSRTK